MKPYIESCTTFALLGFAMCALANCDVGTETEKNRITAEFSRKVPSKNDEHAHEAWSRTLHDALALVERKHSDGVRSSRPPPSAAAHAKIDECLASITRRSDEVQKK